MTKYTKAIAAFVGFLGTFAAAHWGFALTPELSGALSSVIGTVLAWIFPNKTA